MISDMKPPRETLVDLYETKRMSTRQIGVRMGVSKTSVRRWLISDEIPLRPTGRGLVNRGLPEFTRDDLYRLVHVEHLGYAEIGALYKTDPTAVPYWLKKFGITRPTIWETRRNGVIVPLPGQEELARMYYGKLMSAQAIAGVYGVSRGPIIRLMKGWGMRLRHSGWRNPIRCADGHIVRSTYEQRVCDWFSAHHIEHTYEPALPFDGRYKADFMVNGWYIEIWGVIGSARYTERKAKKRALYALNGIPLIELTPDSFAKRRARAFEKKMEMCSKPATSSPPRMMDEQLQLRG